MGTILLFYIGWTAGYLHSCRDKEKKPSWFYWATSFWFFSMLYGDWLLWGSLACLIIWIWKILSAFWVNRMEGGDDWGGDYGDPQPLTGPEPDVKIVPRDDDPWNQGDHPSLAPELQPASKLSEIVTPVKVAQ